ncbi:MAG: cold shock domain-containing protein [Caldilineaceae bacterium]
MAKHGQPQDETRYCERCGISFLWSIEEQHQRGDGDKPATHLCSGCRQLLPAAGRERGMVKWYHRQKGYGFLTRHNQPDLYVHRTAVRQGRLTADSLIEFSLGENEQGPMAQDVIVIDEA